MVRLRLGVSMQRWEKQTSPALREMTRWSPVLPQWIAWAEEQIGAYLEVQVGGTNVPTGFLASPPQA